MGKPLAFLGAAVLLSVLVAAAVAADDAKAKPTARQYTENPSASGFDPGTYVTVRTTTGKPLNTAYFTRGCSYKLASLPANVTLVIDGAYRPMSKWTPACTGSLAKVVTNKVMTLSFPDAPAITIKPLNLLLDYKDCGEIH